MMGIAIAILLGLMVLAGAYLTERRMHYRSRERERQLSDRHLFDCLEMKVESLAGRTADLESQRGSGKSKEIVRQLNEHEEKLKKLSAMVSTRSMFRG